MDAMPWWVTMVAFLAFNVPVLLTLVLVPWTKNLGQALNEKLPDGTDAGVTSYSRVTGAIGAAAITALFWSIGNVIITDALSPSTIGNIKPLVSALLYFFLIGAALFLPYAFNQLKSLLPGAVIAGATQPTGIVASAPPIPSTTAPFELAIANISSTIGDQRMSQVVRAIALQVDQHFGPEWKVSAKLSTRRVNLSDTHAPIDLAKDAIIYVGDSSLDTTAGVESMTGYHYDNEGGVPYGFVYLDVAQKYGEEWSVTLSHEVLELLADPTAAMSVAGNGGYANAGWNYALEVCDPTQGDTYDLQGVRVSNFVLRSFFGLPGGSSRLNYLNLEQQPLVPRERGYLQYTDANGGVAQIWGRLITDEQKKARELLGDGRRNTRRSERRFGIR
jgi:hypothetical protein